MERIESEEMKRESEKNDGGGNVEKNEFMLIQPHIQLMRFSRREGRLVR